MGIHPQRKPKRPSKERQDWPKMLYDADGNGKVFQSAAEVPSGFFTVEGDPFAAKKADTAESPNKGLAKELGFKKQELVAALTEAGIEFPANATADDLAAIYQEAAEAQDDEDEDEDDAGEDEDEDEG